MAESIYPTFNLPTLTAPRTSAAQKKYAPSLKFDFEKGDFVLDGAGRLVTCNGHEAWGEWCLKQLATERNTRLAYSDKIGVEIESAARDEPDQESMKLAIERTITEALLVNPATEYVRNFEFTMEGDQLYVSFLAKGREWDDEDALQVVL